MYKIKMYVHRIYDKRCNFRILTNKHIMFIIEKIYNENVQLKDAILKCNF